MLRLKKLFYVIVAISLGGVVLEPAALADRAIVLAADEYCPYNCEPTKAPEGTMVDIAREALKGSGFTVEYRKMPWKRAVEESKNGRIDGVIAATATDAEGLKLIEPAYGSSRTCFYSKSGGSFTYNGIKSLASVKVGVVSGYGYGPELNGYINQHKKDKKRLNFVHSDEAMSSNIKLVSSGHIDLMAEVADVLDYKIRTEKLPLRKVGCTQDAVAVYLALNAKAHAEIGAILSDGIKAMRKDGRLKTILAVYGLEDW